MPPAPTAIPYRRVLVIANPIAGRGRGEKNARELASALSRANVACDLQFPTARGDGRARAERLAPDVELVVVIGGDGTLTEVLAGLPRRDVLVAVLPMGTANVLALDLRLPRDVAGFEALLTRARIQLLDTALVNGSMLSFLVSGVGFDAAVVRALEERRTGPITRLDWVLAGVRAFKAWDSPRLRVEIDGVGVPGEFGQVLVSNIVHYAGYDVLDPGRVFDDGQFEVYMFKGHSRTALLGHMMRGATGRFPSRRVTMRRARRVSVRGDRPAPFQIDGDFRGEIPFELAVGSHPFRLLVP